MIGSHVKGIIGWGGFIFMILFSIFVVWDYVTTKLHNHENRISELETTARPLIVVDKYSSVHLNGDKIYPAKERHYDQP